MSFGRRPLTVVLSQLFCGIAVVLVGYHLTLESNTRFKNSLLSLGPRKTLDKLTLHDTRFPQLYERQLDEGEDYFSAIQAPDKAYEWPWLRDGKFYSSAAVDAYGAVDGYTTFPVAYTRRPWDEYGDHAYDVDMSVADGCYNMSIDAGTGAGPAGTDGPGWDCYREAFDPATGYARRPY